MRYQWKAWDEKVFREVVVPATKLYLRERLGKTEEEDLEVGVDYPIVKNLLGVSVEEGVLRLIHLPWKFVMALVNDLIGLRKEKKKWVCVGTNNVIVLKRWIQRLNLESIDETSVDGYALNYELVEWIEKPFSGIQFKYRSFHTKLLVMYRLFFLIFGSEYYIILEKLS